MQTVTPLTAPPAEAPRASRGARVADRIRAMSSEELIARLQESRDKSAAEVVDRQKRERRARAEAAARRLQAS